MHQNASKPRENTQKCSKTAQTLRSAEFHSAKKTLWAYYADVSKIRILGEKSIVFGPKLTVFLLIEIDFRDYFSHFLIDFRAANSLKSILKF